MPRIEGTTNAQSRFLRAFNRSVTGPAGDEWPSPRVLRRWIRQPGFVRALAEIRAAQDLQARVGLSAARIGAARGLVVGERVKQNLELLRLAHKQE
jgi:hypothetical protein